jgi:hypothetical protein
MFAATARLRRAYEATAYGVRWRGRDLVLRIGARPPSLPWGSARLAWFLTASNPRSRLYSAAANCRAGRRLVRVVRCQGWRALPVLAGGDAGDWPEEAGLLVIGPAARAAAALGRRFRQNAILHVSCRTVALFPLN